MDRKLVRRNLRTSLIATAVVVVMFGLSFVAAWLYTI